MSVKLKTIIRTCTVSRRDHGWWNRARIHKQHVAASRTPFGPDLFLGPGLDLRGRGVLRGRQLKYKWNCVEQLYGPPDLQGSGVCGFYRGIVICIFEGSRTLVAFNMHFNYFSKQKVVDATKCWWWMPQRTWRAWGGCHKHSAGHPLKRGGT